MLWAGFAFTHAQSAMVSRRTQCLDRLQPSGFASGVVAEKDTDSAGKADSEHVHQP
ncbi:hypothetical protein EV128_119140 [Rhizobium azibense]|nr:hypothetical protein EV128_119140 [Rhizobium azibense]